MTNPTTPLPVQEPAGAVEALISAALQMHEALHDIADESDAEGYLGEADLLHSAANMLKRLAALASLPPVTQAKSEAVAWRWRYDSAKRWVLTDKPMNPGDEFEVQPLYAAPQEAVERQPLTPAPSQYIRAHQYLRRREADIGAGELDELLAIFGIGPATQEEQHG